MGQIIDIPGKGPVEFPDNMRDEEIVAAIKGMEGQHTAPEPTLASEAGAIASQTRGGLLAIPGLMGDAVQGAWDAGAELTGHPEAKFPMKPSEALEEITGGKVYRPQTTLGKYAGSIAEGAAANALPFTRALRLGEGLAKPMAVGAGVGAGAETGGQVSGEENNPVMRLLGGLVGGVVPAMVLGHRPAHERVLAKSMEGLTARDFAEGEALRQTLRDEDIPHLASGLYGSKTSLGDVVSAAATNPGARNMFLDHMRGGADAAEGAIDNWLTRNLATGVNSRSEVLENIQETSENYLKGVRAQGNQKFRDAMPPGLDQEKYSQEEMFNAYKLLGARMLDDNAGPTSEVGARLANLQKRLIDQDATKKARAAAIQFVKEAEATGDAALAAEARGFLNQGLDPRGTGEPLLRFITQKGHVSNLLSELNKSVPEAGMKGLPLNAARDVMREITPDYEAARAAKRQHIEDVYNPESKGLVGDLARIGGGVKPDRVTANERAFSLVMNADRPQKREIQKLFSQIGHEPLGDLTREYISKTVNQSFRAVRDVDKIDQPYLFTQALVGTRAQKENLDTLLSENAKALNQPPGEVLNGFHKLLRALDSTQYMRLPSQINQGALNAALGENVASMVVAPNSRIGRAGAERQAEAVSRAIGKIVTDPKGHEILRRIALEKKPQMVRALATSLLATSDSEPEQSPGITTE